MFKTNTIFFVLFLLLLSNTSPLIAQSNPTKINLRNLPIEISWDNFGIKIRASDQNVPPGELLRFGPSAYFTKVGNDFIRINLEAKNTPININFNTYLDRKNKLLKEVSLVEEPSPFITLDIPKLSLSNNQDTKHFTLKLINFAGSTNPIVQEIHFLGLDLLNVVSDNCAKVSFNEKVISMDVSNCSTKQLLLQGGLLNLTDIDTKIPELCKKYNNRYYIKREAFICLEDCKGEDPNTEKNFRHVRDLITKYNVTDYQDNPLSFLDNILLTKNGIGLNLKIEDPSSKSKVSRKKKSMAYSPYDDYKFFSLARIHQSRVF